MALEELMKVRGNVGIDLIAPRRIHLISDFEA